ncbi:HalOD1 output domain-containing protein [Halobacteriales archaeon Cl-PHB]
MDKMSHRRQTAQSDEPLVHRIVTKIAAREGVDPTELQPLGAVIDVDALESLVGEGGRFTGQVTFTYLDYEVTVERDEAASVTVSPA